eukprot:718018-Pyramimonas_sp.AAC.1
MWGILARLPPLLAVASGRALALLNTAVSNICCNKKKPPTQGRRNHTTPGVGGARTAARPHLGYGVTAHGRLPLGQPRRAVRLHAGAWVHPVASGRAQPKQAPA